MTVFLAERHEIESGCGGQDRLSLAKLRQQLFRGAPGQFTSVERVKEILQLSCRQRQPVRGQPSRPLQPGEIVDDPVRG